MSETTPCYSAGQEPALCLMQCPIAGFQHHGGEACWDRIRPGDGLVLRREPGNRHDPRAVTVEWHDVMLGFVPREANFTLAQMMDSGIRVAGRVARMRQGADPWQRVMIDVVAYPAAVAPVEHAHRPPEELILAPALAQEVPRLKFAAAVGTLTPAQRQVGVLVLRDCVPEIARRLALPLVGVKQESGRAVHAWSTASIEIGADGRGLRTRYLEVPASAGPGATLDLRRPLGDRGWLACFVPVIARVCERHGLTKANMVEPLRRWVGASLELTFAGVVDFDALRKAALQFLAPDPLARALANRIFSTSPSAEAFNWACGRASSIALCAVEHPAMLRFLRICHGEKGLEAPADPLQALRKRLEAEGIAPAAWRNLAEWSFTAFQGLGEAWCKPIPVARFANLLQRLQAEDPPREFAELALRAALHGAGVNAKLDFERHPLWFMRALYRELAQEEGENAALLRRELPLHLDWLIANRPTPDANQQHAGWSWIREQARAWSKARALALAAPWPVPLREMAWGPYRVVAITSAEDLAAEAAALKNCLESYEDACRAGDVVVFSVRERATGHRVACFAAQQDEDEGGWAVLEAAGKMNAAVDEEIARIAEAAVVKLNGGRGGMAPPF